MVILLSSHRPLCGTLVKYCLVLKLHFGLPSADCHFGNIDRAANQRSKTEIAATAPMDKHPLLFLTGFAAKLSNFRRRLDARQPSVVGFQPNIPKRLCFGGTMMNNQVECHKIIG